MKNLLFAAIVLLSFDVNAQLSLDGGKYIYHKASRHSGSGTELFDKAQQWSSKNIDRSKATVSSSRDDLSIKVVGSFEDNSKGVPNVISYIYTIEFQRGVYRETFTDFVYKSASRQLPYESKKLGGKKSIIHRTTSMIDEMSNDLKGYMDMELSASEK